MTAQRPTGTVYGRGGVDLHEPRLGLHPVVLGLVAAAALTAMLALGYWIFLRDSPDTPPPVARSATQPAAQVSAPPTTAEPSPSPTAAVTIGTGRMLLSPVADPDTYLVTDGRFAAMSREAKVLTVTKGLADKKCFTVRDEKGRYLRHFDFRLRFDELDDSDLFRKDATFCPADDKPSGAVRLRSKNYPDRLLHRRGAQLYLDKSDGSGAFETDSSFTVRKG